MVCPVLFGFASATRMHPRYLDDILIGAGLGVAIWATAEATAWIIVGFAPDN
jgi:hypothetical protein